jgi:hypothetical protein
MSDARYLPADHTRVHDQPLQRLSIRTPDDKEVGKLVGFVVDPDSRHISGLVMEVAGAGGSHHVASPLVPLRFDERARALCLVDSDLPGMSEFLPDSVSPMAEEDLWIPIVHTAA